MLKKYCDNLSKFLPFFLLFLQPKCGFLPTPCRVRSMLKQRVCRYCMHQYLKVRYSRTIAGGSNKENCVVC